MEEILGPIMFEIPGSDVQGVVRVTRDVVEFGEAPAIVPFKGRQEKSA
jgi:ATP-dependent Clp protease ATP-binding subunit ClpX